MSDNKEITLADIHDILVKIYDVNLGIRKDTVDIYKLLQEVNRKTPEPENNKK